MPVQTQKTLLSFRYENMKIAGFTSKSLLELVTKNHKYSCQAINRIVGSLMKFPLSWLLLNWWLWITILGMSAILIGPFITIYALLAMPSEYRGLATVLIIVGWGFAAGYKDWVISKRREERVKPYSFEIPSETIP